MIRLRSKVTGVRKVERELFKLGKKTGRDAGDTCKEIAGWTAHNLARFVQPIGLGAPALNTMEIAIRRDIRRVAFPVRSGGVSRAEFEAAHRGARNGRGRVPKNSGRSKLPVNAGELESYTKERESRALWAKAGWVTAARKFRKGVRFHKAITRHDAPGSAVFKSSLWKPVATIENKVGYTGKSSVLSKKARTSALRSARVRMRSALTRDLKKRARQTNRRL